MLAIGRFFLGCLLTAQVSTESVERELLVRQWSLAPAVEVAAPESREGIRLRVESLARRARAQGYLEAALVDELRAALREGDATLRLWALRGLVATRRPLSEERNAAGEMALRLTSDPHPDVRIALTKLLALQQEDHPLVFSMLAGLTQDRHPDVARAAVFALLVAPEGGADSSHVDRWRKAAALAIAQLLASAPPQPQTFLEAVEVAASLRAPYRQSLLRTLARDLTGQEGMLGARATVEAARVESGSKEAIDEALLIEGFLTPLPGDEERDLPRAARRRMQREATLYLGVPFAEELASKALILAPDSDPAASEWEGVRFLLECGLRLAPAEELAKICALSGASREWWEIFFDAIRGRAWSFEAEVLDLWLGAEWSEGERWEALRALAASWAADAPLVRDRFDEILHGEDRELARDLFGLLARTQQKIGERLLRGQASAQAAWNETDEILFRAWAAGDRPHSERVGDLDLLSRAAPHEAFRQGLASLLGKSRGIAAASVFELCADLVTGTELRGLGQGGIDGALQWSLFHDERELHRAANAKEDLREIETRIRHALRAYVRGKMNRWRWSLLSSLRTADSVAAEEVGKTAAALLAKGGAEGVELLAGALSEIDVVRIRLEVLLALSLASDVLGVEESSRAVAELRARYSRCDDELKLRILHALGAAVQVAGFPGEEIASSADFLRSAAGPGEEAAQLRTAAVESLAKACSILGSAEGLRELATELGSVAAGEGGPAEAALEARLLTLQELASFRGTEEETALNSSYLAEAMRLVADVMDLSAQAGVEVSEAALVRAELEREVLLPALAQSAGELDERLGAEWSRQLAGSVAWATLRERMSDRKLPRREFVLRSELAAFSVAEVVPSGEVLLVPELDARSALLAVRVIRGQPELCRALLERAVIGFVGEPRTEKTARFDLEARLRLLLLRIEAGGAGARALEASLRFDLASPARSTERAVELIFFPSGAAPRTENALPDRALSLRARALRRLDNLIQTASTRASVQDR